MSKNKINKNANKTSIGGQAVLEGVMMRGSSSIATAVRDSDGVIRLEAERLTPPEKKSKISKLPIIRGAVNFFTSMYTGMKILMRSAEVYGEEEGEPSKFEKWLAEKLKVDIMTLVMTLGVILGLAFSIGLFFVLPDLIGNLIEHFFPMHNVVRNLIEGLIRITIFVVYIALTSLLKDIRRTYMYHGAEHKTIACYEKGLDLTVENVKSCTRVHDRCGTTFMFLVMIVSIVVFSIAGAILGREITGLLKLVIKIALLPLVAGISYEILKGLAKTSSVIFLPLKAPGLLLQRITTSEPDDGMIEVAITSFKKVLSMDANPDEEGCKFILPLKIDVLLENTKKTLADNGITEEAEAEWIVSLVTNLNRSELNGSKTLISSSKVEKINNMTKERITGKPLWYVVGNTEFYGFTIDVNENVLIPRPETEELVELALKDIKQSDRVLDLCCGSGAIGIAIKKTANCSVVCADISSKAIEVAKGNARKNKCDIDFVESNLFDNIQGQFNVIVSNPPYIKSTDIEGLDREVKEFEPHLALDGGQDGLDFYRVISEKASQYLLDGGVLFLEYGYTQAEEIKNLLQEKFSTVTIIKDINGLDRIIKAVL